MLVVCQFGPVAAAINTIELFNQMYVQHAFKNSGSVSQYIAHESIEHDGRAL
jgi:hypothetical protein